MLPEKWTPLLQVRDPTALNDVELLVLLAVVRLPEAYGVTVRREIEMTAGRRLSITTVYGALERLESRGLLLQRLTKPTQTRGGRRKRVYTILPAGAEALSNVKSSLDRMWHGVAVPRGEPA